MVGSKQSSMEEARIDEGDGRLTATSVVFRCRLKLMISA